MKAFVNYILQFGDLTPQETDSILGKAETLKLYKEILL
jgi:hypothetical protein